MNTVNQLLAEHFRCMNTGVHFGWLTANELSSGYFRFGDDVVCFGRSRVTAHAESGSDSLPDALRDVCIETNRCVLSFDPEEVVENLRRERYVRSRERTDGGYGVDELVRSAYYAIRPLLPVPVRKHLQRLFLRGRMDTPFPRWPVDRTTDRFLEKLLALSMKTRGLRRAPFIWFWPEGYPSVAVMTHDVETAGGVAACPELMDLDEQFGIRSSFQLVPEQRYAVPQALLGELRRRGFEINVHDLNHDGRLYWDRQEFLRRAGKINRYRREFGARGFRAAALYRNLDWYDALEFSYDMSVPNVGHLDPQPGGCCTVMPYYVGRILELPVTTIQDYPLFHILGEYSVRLWLQQMGLIQDGHGVISFITHPDYLVERHARRTYADLLGHLARLREEGRLWVALPGEVNDWWRARGQMRLVKENGKLRIEGVGKERARIAYANLDRDALCFEVERDAAGHSNNAEQAIHLPQ